MDVIGYFRNKLILLNWFLKKKAPLEYFDSVCVKVEKCFRSAICGCFIIDCMTVFLCLLFNLRGTDVSRSESVLIYCSRKYASAISQWALMTFKSTKYLFLFSGTLSSLINMTDCCGKFYLRHSCLNLPFPVWYLSMSKNRLNISDMAGTVTELH